MSKIKVLLIENQAHLALQVQQALCNDSRFELIGVADTIDLGVARSISSQSSVVLVNANLPRGLAAVRLLSSQHGTASIVLSDHPSIHEASALRQGAVSVCRYPDFDASSQRHFCNHVSGMSSVRVIRRRLSSVQSTTFKVVGIVASTGGPQALKQIFSKLDRQFSVPILLIQHITAEFSDSFVEWLAQTSGHRFEIATHGTVALPGTIYVAPPGTHLSWSASRLSLIKGQPECWQLPSGSVMLRSLAQNAGPAAIGLVLTGLGEDGASGLLELRQAGGYTIVQDETSSAVYGMPRAAKNLGAASEELPLDSIANRLMELCPPASILNPH